MTAISKIPHLHCQKLIGKGHFSHVYYGSYKNHSNVAIKVIENSSDKTVLKEIKLLKRIKNCPNTLKLIDTFLYKGKTIIITELIESISMSYFFKHAQLKNFQLVLHDLLVALNAVHKLDIVHRDITTNNVIIRKNFKGACLIDWGCGSKVKKHMKPNAGTRSFRSPEMLMGYTNYSTSSDMWGVGVYIFSILSMSMIPWKDRNVENILQKLACFYEHNELIDLSNQIEIPLYDSIISEIPEHPTKTFETYFSSSLAHLQDPSLINLMKSLLVILPHKRLTAEEALKHEFFQKEFQK